MRGTFGWDMPPGVALRHIDEACGGGDEIDPREAYPEEYGTDDQEDEL